MELTFRDAKFFKQCIDAIVNLVDEGTFEVTRDGLHLRCLDPSQIAMVDFNLSKAHAFSEYNVEGSRTVSLNLVDLGKVLARARNTEKLTIKLSDEESNKLLLEFSADSKRTFKLPLLDLRDTAMPREPKVDLEAAVKIRSGVFKEMLKDAVLVSSHLQIESSGTAFSLEAHGDAGDLTIEHKGSKEVEVEGKDGKAMYPSDYLEKMCRAAGEAEPLSLQFGNNKPIRITYKLGEAQLMYFLAPRVETA